MPTKKFRKWRVGELNSRVIDILNLLFIVGTSIYIGEENIKSIKKKHPKDYEKYGKEIKNIIANPTYLAKHPKKNSIEYIKVFKEGEDFVLVAVRASGSGIMFVRSIFIM